MMPKQTDQSGIQTTEPGTANIGQSGAPTRTDASPVTFPPDPTAAETSKRGRQPLEPSTVPTANSGQSNMPPVTAPSNLTEGVLPQTAAEAQTGVAPQFAGGRQTAGLHPGADGGYGSNYGDLQGLKGKEMLRKLYAVPDDVKDAGVFEHLFTDGSVSRTDLAIIAAEFGSGTKAKAASKSAAKGGSKKAAKKSSSKKR